MNPKNRVVKGYVVRAKVKKEDRFQQLSRRYHAFAAAEEFRRLAEHGGAYAQVEIKEIMGKEEL